MVSNKGWFMKRVRYVPLVTQYVYGWSDEGGNGKSDGKGSGSEKEWDANQLQLVDDAALVADSDEK